uniref:Actin n=1 Tax=Peronospora matthiolae TaxID=2874970 RepID=A0AAV1VGE8_9STRA
MFGRPTMKCPSKNQAVAIGVSGEAISFDQ